MNQIELKLNKGYKKGLKGLRQEIEKESPGWIKERRKEYLLGKIFECLVFIKPFEAWYGEATERGADYLTKRIIKIFSKYEKWKERLHKIIMEYKFTILRNPGDNKITPAMIERANEYPIEKVVKVNKNYFALCIFHQDKHPSMYCKRNFFHCFSCGASGSVIDLYMKLHNIDFSAAVEFLCS